MVQRSLLPDYALRHYMRMFQLGDVVDVCDTRTDITEQALITTQGKYLLRVVQDRTLSDARFEESLVFHLSAHGLPVLAMFEAGIKGAVLPVGPRQQLSVFAYPTGRRVGVFEVIPSHMRQIGRFLAGVHHAGRRLRRRRRNGFDVTRMVSRLHQCSLQASDSHVPLLRLLADHMVNYPDMETLPRGIVHGDLTPSHVRFVLGELSDVSGFQRACTGPLLMDLAHALVEWCFLHDSLVVETARSLVRGYLQLRLMGPGEREALFGACCYAAVSRAVDCFERYELKETLPGTPYRDYRHYVARFEELQDHGARRFFRHIMEDADELPLESGA